MPFGLEKVRRRGALLREEYRGLKENTDTIPEATRSVTPCKATDLLIEFH
jgi:hypothetical protein